MKQCIWCRNGEGNATFKKKAHTVPQGLGGVATCDNVCDECNLFFGSHFNGDPSIETIIKETFNVSKGRFLQSDNELGKNKLMPRYKSQYFDIDFKKGKVKLKEAYKLRPSFQERISRLLKRGLYKIFLEENERVNANSLNERFDFIREFARYNIGDFPILYFQRSAPIIATGSLFWKEPHKMFNMVTMHYLLRDYGFFEVEFFGHVLALATTRNYELSLDVYVRESSKIKLGHFSGVKEVKNWNDIDLTLSLFDRETD